MRVINWDDCEPKFVKLKDCPNANIKIANICLQYFHDLESGSSPGSKLSELVSAKYKNSYIGIPDYNDGNGDDVSIFEAEFTAICMRHRLMVATEKAFTGTLTETELAGTFTEKYSGADTDTTSRNPVSEERTFTDDITRIRETKFRGAGTPTSASLADSETESTDPEHQTQKETKKTSFDGDDTVTHTKGTVKTYSDGRTMTARLADLEASSSPVYDFLCDLGKIFIKENYWL